jgi:hypothetical protein
VTKSTRVFATLGALGVLIALGLFTANVAARPSYSGRLTSDSLDVASALARAGEGLARAARLSLGAQPRGDAAAADGDAMILVGTGPGGGQLRAVSALDGGEILSGLPFGAAFSGGVRVAAGDVNADGISD